jgi:type I restriction enzyme, S subunit
MAKWPLASLEEIAATHSGAIAIDPFGSAMKADTYSDVGVPVVRGTNISDTRSWKGDWVFIPEEFADAMPRCVANVHDLVFPHRGSIGEVAIIPPNTHPRYFLSSSLMKITLDGKKANPLFVYYYFRSTIGRAEILKFSSQVGTPGIGQPLSSLKQFRVPLPTLTEQAAIAELLGVLDDKIELNRRMNETLEAMARAIFRDWFVDFGPTRAKQEGREPYLAPEIWSLFPDRLDDAGKPEGWKFSPLLDHARLISGGTPKTEKPEYWGGPIAWASAKDVSQCGEAFLVETERSITHLGLEKSATRLIPALATVVVARGATTGRYCMFGCEMAMNQTCYALASPAGQPYWLRCAFEALVSELVHAAHGSVFDTITTRTIQNAQVMRPDTRLVEVFEDTVAPMFSRLLANTLNSRTLGRNPRSPPPQADVRRNQSP